MAKFMNEFAICNLELVLQLVMVTIALLQRA